MHRVQNRRKLWLDHEQPLPETITSGQQMLIRDALRELGTANAAQIAEQIKGKLKTKQEPQRVVSYYLADWKKRGYVRAVA